MGVLGQDTPRHIVDQPRLDNARQREGDREGGHRVKAKGERRLSDTQENER